MRVPSAAAPLRVGLIGFGAIGSEVAKYVIGQRAGHCVVSHVLVRTVPRPEAEQRILDAAPSPPWIGTSKSEFLAGNWDLAVEMAGQPVVRETAAECLSSGRDYLMTSIGVLTDDALRDELETLATASGSRLYLCAGAMPGIDWMASAALAHSDDEEPPLVTVTQLKPPQSWYGTPAETSHDLGALSEYTVLFEGSAREASSSFPKNSNVATMLALSTAGLDQTRVRLVTDPTKPTAGGSTVELSSPVIGSIKIEVNSKMSRANPKTGVIVAPSVVKAIRNLSSNVFLGL